MIVGCDTNLNLFKNKQLEDIKKDATVAKETLEMSKQCLNLSKSIKEANECNQKAKEHYNKFNIDNFKKWNKNIKKRALSTIDEKLQEANCVLNATNIQVAKECLMNSVDNNTTIKKNR